jgi:hypothetical protein
MRDIALDVFPGQLPAELMDMSSSDEVVRVPVCVGDEGVLSSLGDEGALSSSALSSSSFFHMISQSRPTRAFRQASCSGVVARVASPERDLSGDDDSMGVYLYSVFLFEQRGRGDGVSLGDCW